MGSGLHDLIQYLYGMAAGSPHTASQRDLRLPTPKAQCSWVRGPSLEMPHPVEHHLVGGTTYRVVLTTRHRGEISFLPPF